MMEDEIRNKKDELIKNQFNTISVI